MPTFFNTPAPGAKPPIPPKNKPQPPADAPDTAAQHAEAPQATVTAPAKESTVFQAAPDTEASAADNADNAKKLCAPTDISVESPSPDGAADATPPTPEASEPAPDSASIPPVSEPLSPPAVTSDTPAFQLPAADHIVINGFLFAKADSYEKLNADFGLSLTKTEFQRLQLAIRERLLRPVTVGELRFLSALNNAGRGRADREAVGELVTASPLLAETWADMMEKHARLHRAHDTAKSVAQTPTPPLSYAGALSLSERFLHRSGALPHWPCEHAGMTYTVLTAPYQKAQAVAAGLRPVAELALVDSQKALSGMDIYSPEANRDAATETDLHSILSTVTVAAGSAGFHERPANTGDYLILLPAASVAAVADFLAADASGHDPAVGAARAISGTSLIETILELVPGADIYTHYLTDAPTLAEASEKSTASSDPAPSGTASEPPAEASAAPVSDQADAPSTATALTPADSTDPITTSPPLTTGTDIATEEQPAPPTDTPEDPAAPVSAPKRTPALQISGGFAYTAHKPTPKPSSAPKEPASAPAEGPLQPATAERSERMTDATAETLEAPAAPPTPPLGVTAKPADTGKNTVNATVRSPRKTVPPPRKKKPYFRLPLEKLTKFTLSDGETADFLLRVPYKRTAPLTDALRTRHIKAVALGQVTATDHLRLFAKSEGRDSTVVDLPICFIREAIEISLHHTEPNREPAQTMPPCEPMALLRLPGLTTKDSGLTPEGYELVALSLPRASTLTLTDIGPADVAMSLSAAATTVTACGTGFDAAARVLEAATRPLRDAGIRPSDICVAISLDVYEDLAAEATSVEYPGTQTTEILCGLYRVCAENGLLPPDPSIRVLPPTSMGAAVGISIVAWHLGKALEATQDGQWTSGHLASASGTSNPNTPGTPSPTPTPIRPKPRSRRAMRKSHDGEAPSAAPHATAEPPVYLLPVLRRSREASLRTLAVALTYRETADCRICPVPIKTEAVAETTDTPEIIVPTAAKKLAERMDTASAILLAMSEEDVRLLLADETVRAALERVVAEDRLMVAFGRAAIPLAEMGWLPSSLAHLTTCTTAGLTAEVTHPAWEKPFLLDVLKQLIDGGDEYCELSHKDRCAKAMEDLSVPPTIRFLRCDLLRPTEDTDREAACMQLRLPDGQVIADAYADESGKILAVLNGVDPTLADTIHRMASPWPTEIDSIGIIDDAEYYTMTCTDDEAAGK